MPGRSVGKSDPSPLRFEARGGYLVRLRKAESKEGWVAKSDSCYKVKRAKRARSQEREDPRSWVDVDVGEASGRR